MRPFLAVAPGFILAFAGSAAVGQTAGESDTLVTTDECEVSPLEDAAPPAAGETLSDTLAPCDGVLQPAPVGDQEMIIVPPPVGETPVIEPDEIPVQPADPE